MAKSLAAGKLVSGIADPSKMARLSSQVDNLQVNINTLNALKDQTIARLESEKNYIREQINKGVIMKDRSEDYTLKIQYITEKHADIMAKIESKRISIKDIKYDVQILNEVIDQMDVQISKIQASHDDKIVELEDKKEDMRKKLNEVEQLGLLFNALTYKLFETQENHAADIEALEAERAQILKDPNLSESARALALAKIDKEVADREQQHEEMLMSLREQRISIELQSNMKLKEINSNLECIDEQGKMLKEAWEMEQLNRDISRLLADIPDGEMTSDETTRWMKSLKDALEDLKRRKLNATPSELELINEKMKVLNDQIRLLKEKEMMNSLEEKGLKITPSGHLRTPSGRYITLEEAKILGYISDSDKLVLANLLLKRQQDFLGAGDSFHSPSSSSTKSSNDTRMSSEDVHYLKTMIGKPLSLGLAEVTMKQPKDPIHYLAHWLVKYRYNQELSQKQKQDFEELDAERTRIAQEMLHKLLEEEAHNAILEMINRAEIAAIKRQMDEEMRRIAMEAAMAEEEEYDSEARDTLGVYEGPPIKQNLPA